MHVVKGKGSQILHVSGPCLLHSCCTTAEACPQLERPAPCAWTPKHQQPHAPSCITSCPSALDLWPRASSRITTDHTRYPAVVAMILRMFCNFRALRRPYDRAATPLSTHCTSASQCSPLWAMPFATQPRTRRPSPVARCCSCHVLPLPCTRHPIVAVAASGCRRHPAYRCSAMRASILLLEHWNVRRGCGGLARMRAAVGVGVW